MNAMSLNRLSLQFESCVAAMLLPFRFKSRIVVVLRNSEALGAKNNVRCGAGFLKLDHLWFQVLLVDRFLSLVTACETNPVKLFLELCGTFLHLTCSVICDIQRFDI